jgi:hypothetical protein
LIKVYPALNQLAGTGWLAGDVLKNFISRLVLKNKSLNIIGLEIFPLPDSTRRQLIHRPVFRSFSLGRLDLLFLFFKTKEKRFICRKWVKKWGKSSYRSL